MTHDDIAIAIAHEFRKSLPNLTFNNFPNLTGIEAGISPVFTLQENYEGTGVYHVIGSAKLFDREKAYYTWYNLAFPIIISEVEGSPSIQINSSVISCTLK